ncbi:MAG: DNA primase DnaG [Sulfolobales archaeon]|nr:DNA primase DnaG [Sulfolobales archaeon]MDW7969784.1 DNA primase DnaG [Sulfolobales archaeon]
MKYLIRARMEVDGNVDKPDVIGAIFGQTEGLFGSEFDLRELQDKGRIGRIIIDSKQQGGKTVGEIIIPSNLDRVETALVAAMLEFVDKVGPYNAKIQVLSIVDVRFEKIKKISDRAKEILHQWFKEKPVDVKEILNEIESSVRTAEVTYYGPEKLPAGPDVDKVDTIIVVEGKADVANLLRYGYRNVIAIEGAKGKIPETVVSLSKQKTVIAFVDGDHAGDLILRELIRVAEVDYIAKAPVGKEVEELTGKEIAKALKNVVPIQTYLQQTEKKEVAEKTAETAATQATEQPLPETNVPEVEGTFTYQVPQNVVEELRKLSGTLEAVIYDSNWTEVGRVAVKDLVDHIVKLDGVNIHAIIMDGIITQRVVDAASVKGVRIIVGSRVGVISKKPVGVAILSAEEILH